MPVRNWSGTLSQLYIIFGDRMKLHNFEKNSLGANSKWVMKILDTVRFTLPYQALQASTKLAKNTASLNFGIRPCKHHYPVGLIWQCVQFQLYAGVSFRSCWHCLIQFYLLLSLNYRIPSHVSIRNWACKCGYCRLKKIGFNQLKSVDKYAVIVDESISIGAERLLLVLGLALDNWQFEKAASLADIEVLSLRVSREWKSEQVSSVLSEVEKHYKIGYVVSDMGNNLLKSYQNNAYIHLPDITHIIARALERIYKKDALFMVMNLNVWRTSQTLISF